MATEYKLPFNLAEATRLMRSGRLREATAAIQLAIGGRQSGRQSTQAAGRVIEAEFSRVEEPRVTSREPRAPTRRPGEFIATSHTGPAGSRPYKLYVPSGYAGKPLPMIVMLHGCTQTPDDFAAGTRMNLLAEDQPCFVLYPAQTQGANRTRCWNWFKRGDQRRGQGEPAIIAGMTLEAMKSHAIDERRVWVAGLSAGGAMAAVMGATYPELYAAIGVHSGLAAGSAHDVPSAFAAMRGAPSPNAAQGAGRRHALRRVPLIVFHGDRDTTVHPRNGEQMIVESLDGCDATLKRSEQGRVPGGHAYTRTVHFSGEGRTLLEYWLVHGGAHAWSGGSRLGSFTDPKGPDASREMMRFFHGLPEHPG